MNYEKGEIMNKIIIIGNKDGNHLEFIEINYMSRYDKSPLNQDDITAFNAAKYVTYQSSENALLDSTPLTA